MSEAKGMIKNMKAIIISCFDWYDQRLELIYKYLKEKCEVLVYTSDYDHIKKKEITNKNENCIYIHVPQYKRNLSFKRIFSHISFSINIKKILKEEKPDIIYALAPVNSLVYICAKYKNKKKCKLICDIIDLWPESLPMGNNRFIVPYNIWRYLRNYALRKSDIIITECYYYIDRLKIANKKNVYTVPLFKKINVNDRKSVETHIANLRINNDKKIIKLGYVGSINNIIDIEAIKKVCIQLKNRYDIVWVKIIGDGENKNAFINMLKQVGCEVDFYGKIFDEKEKIKILGECDYGLNMMVDTVSVGLTIKSIDYLSYGLPLINNIKGDTWELVNTKKIGVNIQSENNDIEISNKKMHWNALNCFDNFFSEEVAQRLVSSIMDKL